MPAWNSAAVDPAALALSHLFEQGELILPHDGVLVFLGARPGPVLTLAPRENWRCQQSFKPRADALTRVGFASRPSMTEDGAAVVLCLPTRQREEARAMFANALSRVRPGGLVLAAMANNEGARSGESDFKALAGSVASASKHKCRIFWVQRDDDRIDADLLAQWQSLDAPQPILEGRYRSRPGLFAWNRIDPASALLVEHLPPMLTGRVADLGGGWGYLSLEVLRRCPAVEVVHLYEAEARALESARMNLDRHAGGTAFELHWHDVTTGLPQRYDAIVSNPPFHQGRPDEPDLGRGFIRAAADALTPAGEFWLVANRHLPYESTLAECFTQVRHVVDAHGYKLVQARGPRR